MATQTRVTWQAFVGRRVSEIHGIVPPSNWKHVPGVENPADLCSRGCSASELIKSEKWWYGPEFLRKSKDNWPLQDNITTQTAVETALKKKSKSFPVPVLQIAGVNDSKIQDDESDSIQRNEKKTSSTSQDKKIEGSCDEEDPLLYYTKLFSSHFRFIRAMSRARSLFSKQKSAVSSEECKLDLWKQEEKFWLKWVKSKEFPGEIKALQEGRQLPRSSRLKQLDPFLDEDGLIRVGGRIQEALLPEETIHPIVLPCKNELVEKLVIRHHRRDSHTGVEQTRASLRTKYWILRGRKEVSRILYKCECREPEPMKQKMGR
ncbi:uncharacterized protein LOC141912263 [Tubulanus polymorphus]|uniref:uncharacterized protein LOC141912263 n=1 Tax=Tubulanus polymorphus TaxID=672921 RepID=UPI003DA1E6EF